MFFKKLVLIKIYMCNNQPCIIFHLLFLLFVFEASVDNGIVKEDFSFISITFDIDVTGKKADILFSNGFFVASSVVIFCVVNSNFELSCVAFFKLIVEVLLFELFSVASDLSFVFLLP